MARNNRSSPLLRAVLLVGLCALAKHAWGPALTVKGAWEGELTELSLGDLLDGLAPKGAIAASQGYVSGLGAVKGYVKSDGEFGVEVMPNLPVSSVAGVELAALASSHGDGIAAKLMAGKKLGNYGLATYSVENKEGDYSLADLKHTAVVAGELNDGSLALKLTAVGADVQDYNATYTHDLSSLLKGDTALVVGVDNDGVYTSLLKDHAIGGDMTASYAAAGKATVKGEGKTFSHSLKLGHGLGSLTLSHGSGQPLAGALQMGVSKGPATVSGKFGYALNDELPTYDLTLSGKLPSGVSASIGVDDASVDGLYGKVAASRKVGDYTVEGTSSGRVSGMDHSLKVSSALGSAELVKSGDSTPKVKIAYEFDV